MTINKKFVDYVPQPEPVSSDYYIACHYFPGWNVRANGASGFSKIVDFPERTPPAPPRASSLR